MPAAPPHGFTVPLWPAVTFKFVLMEVNGSGNDDGGTHDRTRTYPLADTRGAGNGAGRAEAGNTGAAGEVPGMGYGADVALMTGMPAVCVEVKGMNELGEFPQPWGMPTRSAPAVDD